nr:expressed protein [Hymenolepis microstoma]
MEISREYQPFFGTTVKGLAKVKLQGHAELPREKVYQIIASYAVRDGPFEDYKMLVYNDRIHFEKSPKGFSFPEIPYSSIVRLVVLPNFPDVCFIHFRRNTYGMYVVFRVRKVNYLPKLAKFISTWNEANTTDTENSQAQPTQNLGGLKAETYPHRTPIIIQCPKRPQHTEKSVPRRNHRSPAKSRSKPRTSEGLDFGESCEFVCIKHDHKVAPPRQSRRRSYSPLRERVRVRVRRKSYPDPKVKNYRPRFKSQSGKYTIIVPTLKKIEPPKGFNRDSKEMRSPQRGRVIMAKASETDSQSSSSRNVELVNFNGDEVRTIYPSSLDLGKLSPTSLRNEQLVQKLRKPLNGN